MTNELLAEVSLLRNKVKKYEEAWEKVKEEIDKWYDLRNTTNSREKLMEIIDKHIHEVEDKNNITIEEKATTNGEVIQKVFSKDKFRIISRLNYVEQWHNGDHVHNYLYEWWISKYEGESNG